MENSAVTDDVLEIGEEVAELKSVVEAKLRDSEGPQGKSTSVSRTPSDLKAKPSHPYEELDNISLSSDDESTQNWSRTKRLLFHKGSKGLISKLHIINPKIQKKGQVDKGSKGDGNQSSAAALTSSNQESTQKIFGSTLPQISSSVVQEQLSRSATKQPTSEDLYNKSQSAMSKVLSPSKTQQQLNTNQKSQSQPPSTMSVSGNQSQPSGLDRQSSLLPKSQSQVEKPILVQDSKQITQIQSEAVPKPSSAKIPSQVASKAVPAKSELREAKSRSPSPQPKPYKGTSYQTHGINSIPLRAVETGEKVPEPPPFPQSTRSITSNQRPVVQTTSSSPPPPPPPSSTIRKQVSRHDSNLSVAASAKPSKSVASVTPSAIKPSSTLSTASSVKSSAASALPTAASVKSSAAIPTAPPSSTFIEKQVPPPVSRQDSNLSAPTSVKPSKSGASVTSSAIKPSKSVASVTSSAVKPSSVVPSTIPSVKSSAIPPPPPDPIQSSRTLLRSSSKPPDSKRSDMSKRE